MKEEETYEFYREQTLLLTEEYKELKKRIDKAIELLNENYNALFIEEDVNYIGEGCYHDLLNILKGNDKND